MPTGALARRRRRGRRRSSCRAGPPAPCCDMAPFPLKIASAHGSRLVDLDGHEYVDLLGDYSAGLLGHSPAAVAAAVQGALERGWSYGATHGLEAELARLVCERFPSIEQVRFTNSGTEANLMAIAAARHHTGRSKVLVFDGGYHGGALVFGPGGAARACPFPFVICRYNDLTSVAEAFENSGDDRPRARRADARCRRLHPGVACIPRRAARRVRCQRDRARVRRGDDVADVGRRWPAAARHHAGHDHARQVPRRRDDVWRLRRIARR